MGDNASLLRLDGQPPVIRLIISLLFTVVTGTIIFWIFIWCGTLIFDATAAEITLIPVQGAGERQIAMLRYVQVSQQIGLFLVPSFFLAVFLRREGESYLRMNCSPGISSFILIAILVVIILPVISWTSIINSRMDLPDWLSWVEGTMREKEDRASDIMGFLLGSDGISGMAVNLFTLALIPAFAEELLFRGILQQLFIKVFRSAHAGIWITSILFSAVHFQFYGFLPRMILGLLFGYLFIWTGSLWSAIVPHFINNAIPVVMTFLSGLTREIVKLEEPGSIFPFIHMTLSLFILYYLWHLSQKKRSD
jgi:membrane protease YdiL (CAAX protease family)